jgi:hypothetical protein
VYASTDDKENKSLPVYIKGLRVWRIKYYSATALTKRQAMYLQEAR